MRNKGLSIIELTVAMVISTIIGLAITFNFLTAHYLRNMTQDNVALSREARIAMNHMARVLRFAIPDHETIPISTALNQISAPIEGGHLSFITTSDPPTTVVYTLNTTDDTLEYTQGTEAAVIIAGGGERDIDITHFNPTLDGSEIKIELTVQKEDRSVSLLTKIRPLGE